MHKKAIALLSAALVLLTFASACEKHSKYGKLYVDGRGMEHVLVTDAKGETIVDADGNLVEVMTDTNGKPIPAITENGTVAAKQEGEYQTSPVTFPNVIVSDDKIEDTNCVVQIPAGWEAQKSGDDIMLTQTATGARVVIRANAARTAAAAIESIQKDCEETGVACTADTAQLDGFEAKVLRYTALGTDFTAYAVNNRIEEYDSTVICMTDEGKADQTDFSEILQNIHFK